jgi:hypothetical protein
MTHLQRSASIKLALLAAATLGAAEPTTAPVGSAENPKHITSADPGPDIDAAKLAASPYDGIPMFRTFRSFMSSSYATAQVWLYAADDDQKIYNTKVSYVFPEFYTPTWGEVFDQLARQMQCKWSFDTKNRQFRFERSDAPPSFGVTLADGWRREDRGMYVWHAPADQDFGMDIYSFGHYTPTDDKPTLHDDVRAHFALQTVSDWPDAPKLTNMTTVKVAGVDALYLHIDTPRPGGVWRQWSFVLDGEAFVIVSAMPKENEAKLAPAIDAMVATFSHRNPVTQPAAAK